MNTHRVVMVVLGSAVGWLAVDEIRFSHVKAAYVQHLTEDYVEKLCPRAAGETNKEHQTCITEATARAEMEVQAIKNKL